MQIKLVVIYKRRQAQLQSWDNACGQCVYHIKRQKLFQCISNKVDVAAGTIVHHRHHWGWQKYNDVNMTDKVGEFLV